MGAGVVQREKGWTDVEGRDRATSRGAQGPPEAGKSKGTDSPLGPLGDATCRHLDFSPARPMSGLCQPERNAEGISLCCLQPLGWGNWSERRQEAHGGGRRAEGGPAQPGAGGTWCGELLIFGAQEKPPWTPSCRTL